MIISPTNCTDLEAFNPLEDLTKTACKEMFLAVFLPNTDMLRHQIYIFTALPILAITKTKPTTQKTNFSDWVLVSGY